MANFTPQEIEQFLQEFFDVVGARQYVGARYVPVFGHGRDTSVDWDGGADAYEPLSIVYWHGDTYTSRRYVPAGIDIQNGDYWVITGRYNAQVEQYRQEVLSFDGRITDNSEAIAEEVNARRNGIATERAEREAADAAEAQARIAGDQDVLDDVAEGYVPFPTGYYNPKYGNLGQVLSSLTEGAVKWVDPLTIDAETAGPIIDAWLDDHPEATTTVEDGSITPAKLDRTYLEVAGEMIFGDQYLIDDLDDAEPNCVYLLLKTPATNIAHLPSDMRQYVFHTLTTYKSTYSTNQYALTQMIKQIESDVYWVRIYTTSAHTWDDWTKIDVSGDISTINGALPYKLEVNKDMLYASRLPVDDLNDVKPNSVYVMLVTSSTVLAHLPSDYPNNAQSTVTTYKAVHADNGSYFLQQEIRLMRSPIRWVRNYASFNDTWEAWVKEDQTLTYKLTVEKDMIYADRLPIDDLDDAAPNSIYVMLPTALSTIANLPSDYPNLAQSTVATYRAVHADNGSYFLQQEIRLMRTPVRWVRNYASFNDTWEAWVKEDLTPPTTLIECGPGKQFTTLRSAIAAAIQHRGCRVVVYPKTYDLTAEFATEIAQHTGGQVGIELANDITVDFLAGAYVKALFPTSSDWISQNFAPFYGKNFTLNGLDIESSNCRYCVHDEQWDSTEPYHNVYMNCTMHHSTDMSGSGITQVWPAALGIGFGKNGHIEIIGGRYTADGDTDPAGYCSPISAHNSPLADAYSVLSIRDVYIDGTDGRFRFGYYGASTLISQISVSGCSMKGAIIKRPETGEALIDNFAITQWNNEIRS